MSRKSSKIEFSATEVLRNLATFLWHQKRQTRTSAPPQARAGLTQSRSQQLLSRINILNFRLGRLKLRRTQQKCGSFDYLKSRYGKTLILPNWCVSSICIHLYPFLPFLPLEWTLKNLWTTESRWKSTFSFQMLTCFSDKAQYIRDKEHKFGESNGGNTLSMLQLSGWYQSW